MNFSRSKGPEWRKLSILCAVWSRPKSLVKKETRETAYPEMACFPGALASVKVGLFLYPVKLESHACFFLVDNHRRVSASAKNIL